MVEVNTTSGVVYEGVLRAVSPNMDIVLSVAHDKSKVVMREREGVVYMCIQCFPRFQCVFSELEY